jgi:hypothetical protein
MRNVLFSSVALGCLGLLGSASALAQGEPKRPLKDLVDSSPALQLETPLMGDNGQPDPKRPLRVTPADRVPQSEVALQRFAIEPKRPLKSDGALPRDGQPQAA